MPNDVSGEDHDFYVDLKKKFLDSEAGEVIINMT
jgi:hypothetical protein